MNKARQTILKLVSEGKITVEEADELLEAVESSTGKPIFNPEFYKNRQAEAEARPREAKVREKAEQARQRAEQARQRWEQRRGSGHREGFEFNFPWDQPDWEWPWDRQDWQWPWEHPDWEWPWDKPGAAKSASVFEVPEEAILNVKNDGGDLVIIGTEETSLKISGQDRNRKVQRDGDAISIASAGSDFTIEAPARITNIGIQQNGGDLRIENPASDLAIKISGDLSISRATGNIHVASEGGDIHLTDTRSNEVAVHVNGGDISLSMAPSVEEGTIALNADSGDISLLLPPGSKCQITASTTDGEISHTLKPGDTVEIIDETEQALIAKLNGGGAEIVLATKSGDISIKA